MNSNGGGSIPLPDLRTQHVFEPMRLSREPLRGWYPRVAIDFVLSHLDTRGYRRFSGAAALPERLLTIIDQAAAREGESRSGLLARAALEYVERHGESR